MIAAAAGMRVLVATKPVDFRITFLTETFHGSGPPVYSRFADLSAAGMCHREEGRVVLTRRGRLLASDVTARLLLAGAACRSTADHAGTRYD